LTRKDFADACLVALSEALHINTVFTTDRHGFASYRPPRGKRYALVPERLSG
jgi:predicted nucleic acid-binding protein